MSIRDISGIFSRFFITGFFLPSFFSLFVLWISVSDAFLPNDFARQSNQAQILILGGVSVLAGLIVLGLRHPIIQVFEGYYFRFRPLGPVLARLQGWSRARVARTNSGSGLTAWRLDRLFPAKEEGEDEKPEKSRLLPTRVGNAVRAAEDHAWLRWGLDHIAVWPRIDPLLSEREQELHSNARSDLYFFLNSVVGSIIVGVVLIADEIAHRRLGSYSLVVYAIPFLLGYILYRMSVGAAERWGLEMRASVDLHRLELYEKLGVRRPVSPDDERELARAVNALLLRGERLPAGVWDNPANAKRKGAQAMIPDTPGEAAAGEPREEREPSEEREGSPGEPREPEPSPGEPREEPSPGEPRGGETEGESGEASPGEPRN